MPDTAGVGTPRGRLSADNAGLPHTRRQIAPDLELFEREHELQTLDAQISSACQGIGRLVTVEGAAGIGKTQLLAAARAPGSSSKSLLW